VEWKGGHLGPGTLGAIGEKNTGGTEFRDQVAIYILHDSAFSPVYVGQTGAKGAKLFQRLCHHNRNPKMQHWDYFSWFGFRDVRPDGSLVPHPDTVSITLPKMLDEFESLLILLLEPKKNRQSGKWQGVEEYFQVSSHEGWGYTINDVIAHLHRLEKMIVQKGLARRSHRTASAMSISTSVSGVRRG
jgi:hypothetical protein